MGGEIGSNGTNTPNLNLIGGIKNGAAGVDGGNADGGDAADVTEKHLTIGSESGLRLVITGTPGSAGGDVTSPDYSYPEGGGGAGGHGGGSVFGGISTGGAAGYSGPLYEPNSSSSANGGNGGNVSDNKITISGESKISGSIYGGISQGGAKGKVEISGIVTDGIDGKGGLTQNNTVTIIGDKVSIAGSIFGGLSIDGGRTLASANVDEKYESYYKGNTLNIQDAHFDLNGSIENFQYFNWLLPEDEFDGDTIITVTQRGTAVNLNHTVHSVDVQATGNVLNAGRCCINRCAAGRRLAT